MWSTRIVRKKVVYPKKSGCRGVNCASLGVNERENRRPSSETGRDMHPGVLYTNFYGTLSLKNNTLGRLLEKVAYLKLQGVTPHRSKLEGIPVLGSVSGAADTRTRMSPRHTTMTSVVRHFWPPDPVCDRVVLMIDSASDTSCLSPRALNAARKISERRHVA